MTKGINRENNNLPMTKGINRENNNLPMTKGINREKQTNYLYLDVDESKIMKIKKKY